MRFFCLVILCLLPFYSTSFSQSKGELSVSFTSSDAGGLYQPSNALAVWIEDADGNFVKTLKAYASICLIYLNNWRTSTLAAGTPFNRVDAITGATAISHETRICTWDGKDFRRNIVADGTYKLRMELTDGQEAANHSTFLFEKSENNYNSNPADEPSFSNISIVWEPNTNSVNKNKDNLKPDIYPNPNYGVININSEQKYFAELKNIKGQLIFAEKTSLIDITEYPKGVYFLKLSLGKQVFNYKIIKID